MDGPGSILFDLSEFLREPLRSGIQRVSFEVVRHWPGPSPLLPVRVGPGKQLLALPEETLTRMREFFGVLPGCPVKAREWLVRIGQEGGIPVHLEDHRALLNTEVFCDYQQVSFYEDLLSRGRGDRIFFLVYDMLPWTQPRWFHQAIVTFPLPYLRLLRSLRHLAFISEQVRTDFLSRVLRQERATGPVLPLGGDGLGTHPPQFDPTCRQLAMIGTLEPRKNVSGVLAAFEVLWAEGVEVELVCAGRMGWLHDRERERILRLAEQEKRFRWLAAPTDEQVRELIRTSRATLYVSQAEGFGLPPLESLALGVPVIVTASLPSVSSLPELGQIRLEKPEPGAIERAIRLLLDDVRARELTEEIARLSLPGWAGFVQRLLSWVLQESARTGSTPAA